MKTNIPAQAARLAAQRVFPISGSEGFEGLTFREALAALLWIQMAPTVPFGLEETHVRTMARAAIRRADLLLAELATEQVPDRTDNAVLDLDELRGMVSEQE